VREESLGRRRDIAIRPLTAIGLNAMTQNKHKARPALLNDILQKRKLGDYKGSARGNWEAEKYDFEKEWGRTAFLLG
jgi:hypothetical protein